MDTNLPTNDIEFSPARLARITAETFVRALEFYPELPSTNDLALVRAADPSAQLPLLILAERQTAGRGRGANRWWAVPGALTFSLLLDSAATNLPPDTWPQVALTAGLAVCEAVGELAPNVNARLKLKWPNDVYLGQRKLCGILVEAPPRRQGRLVVGIGINVNNSFQDAPAELQTTATALCDAAARSFCLVDVLVSVLTQLAERLTWIESDLEALHERWRQFCLLTGRTIQVTAGSRQTTGCCRGIDHHGALVLDTETGRERCFAGVVTKIDW